MAWHSVMVWYGGQWNRVVLWYGMEAGDINIVL